MGLPVICAAHSYRRLHVLLRRERFAVNHKRVYRLYREEGLMVRQPEAEADVRGATGVSACG